MYSSTPSPLHTILACLARICKSDRRLAFTYVLLAAMSPQQARHGHIVAGRYIRYLQRLVDDTEVLIEAASNVSMKARMHRRLAIIQTRVQNLETLCDLLRDVEAQSRDLLATTARAVLTEMHNVDAMMRDVLFQRILLRHK
jgi:hypothetical protein